MYDPNIIHKHAQRLYARADFIVVAHGILGALIGLVLGYGAGTFLDELGPVLTLMMTVLAAALGVFVGRAKSFELMLAAQTALCQVQIEVNTRARPTPSYVPPHMSG